jgi:hypothetical protein
MTTNTAVKPIMNPTAHFTVLLVFRSVAPPAKYIIYTGNMCNKHGEVNVIIPSRNVSAYCTYAPPPKKLLFSIN